MSIDISKRNLINLRDVPELFPLINGKPLHKNSIYRWARRGQNGVILETIQVKKQLFTTKKALQQFFDRLNRLKSKGKLSFPPDTNFSDDFTVVRWEGVDFFFSLMQSAIVRALVESARKGIQFMKSSNLLEDAESKMSTSRISPIFVHNGVEHPAWGVMIIQGSQAGYYGLNLI